MKPPTVRPPVPHKVSFMAGRLHAAGHIPADLLMLSDEQRNVIARQIDGGFGGLRDDQLPDAATWQAAIARLRVLIADERLRGTA